MRIRFFNTYEPVTSFFRDLLPALVMLNESKVDVVISAAEYRSGRGDIESAIKGKRIGIVKIPSMCFKAVNRLQKIWVMVSYTIGAALYSLAGPRVDINFFLTQPPLFSIWGAALKLLRGQSYVCLIMDLYPDIAVQDGMLSKSAISSNIATFISRFTLRHADVVIVIGRCMKDYLITEGIDSERIEIITNWADEKNIIPVPCPQNSFRYELSLEDKFIVLYSGNMGTSHAFYDILEVSRRMKSYANIKFVFIGDGVRRKEIETAKELYGLENILLMPFQSSERLSESLSLGDIHFISLKSGFEGLVVPSKAYGAMAAGRPIIYQGEENGEIARMVREGDIGMVVPLNDPDTLENAILKYYRNRALVAEQGQNCRKLATTNFGCSFSIQLYINLLSDLAKKNRV